MRFIDANILVLASYVNDKQQACQDVIREGGIINTLALMETFTVLERIVDRNVAQDAVAAFLRSDLAIVELGVSHLFSALKQSKRTRLKFLDLIHYVTALANDCTEIVSFDRDFDNLALPRIEP